MQSESQVRKISYGAVRENLRRFPCRSRLRTSCELCTVPSAVQFCWRFLYTVYFEITPLVTRWMYIQEPQGAGESQPGGRRAYYVPGNATQGSQIHLRRRRPQVRRGECWTTHQLVATFARQQGRI